MKEHFLASCRGRGMSERTISSYRSVLTELEATCNLRALRPVDVEAFIAKQLQHCSRSSCNTKLMAIRSFVRWAVTGGYLPADVLAQMPKRVKHSSPPARVATRQELDNLLPNLPKQQQLALLLMADSGLRVSEVVSLRVRDIDLDVGLIHVVGKGQVERIAPITTSALRALLQQRLEGAQPNEWVLTGRGQRQMTTSAVRKAIQRTCTRLGNRHLNPHAFRHSFAATAVSRGVDVKALQTALGHSNISVTDRYLRSLAAADYVTSAFARFEQKADA